MRKIKCAAKESPFEHFLFQHDGAQSVLLSLVRKNSHKVHNWILLGYIWLCARPHYPKSVSDLTDAHVWMGANPCSHVPASCGKSSQKNRSCYMFSKHIWVRCSAVHRFLTMKCLHLKKIFSGFVNITKINNYSNNISEYDKLMIVLDIPKWMANT